VTRLSAARATAEFHAARLAKLAHPSESSGTRPPPSTATAAAAGEALKWVSAAADHITQLLRLMDGTATTAAGGVANGGGGNSRAAPAVASLVASAGDVGMQRDQAV
jgi:hypothetical protein